MATYVEVNGTQYEASITGRLSDKDWDNRASKAIRLEMSYEDATKIFVDDIQWNIIQGVEVPNVTVDEDGNETTVMVSDFESYDNSEYSIAGTITDHRNGTITVKMGKPTAEELLAILEEVL